MRPKKCPECGEKYQPTRQMQPCCDKLECKASFAIRHIEAERKRRRMRETKAERMAEAASRKIIKLKLEKLKTARDWTKEAQIAFNAYIRERDKDKPCICCGQPLSAGDIGGAFDCGHYRSVGSAPHLRFDERNAHGQRKQCNRWGAGRVVDYRLGLIARIGEGAVVALESDQRPRKYSIEELKAIKAHYVAKLKELKHG
jgi:hypothetical protein